MIISYSTDIWSLGVIIYKIIYKIHPIWRGNASDLNKGYNALLRKFQNN
jgi:hypothetical protein